MLMVDGEGTPLSAFITDAATSEVQSIETLVDERLTRRKPLASARCSPRCPHRNGAAETQNA